ncbi:hypothetical protein [Burkholderia sp. Ac-20365]|uniref:hypothetical protein n=1 Tax=Burkholderia sp. Ac-20365 TaxID=2703897 RepID=UPI00197B10DA|nr:hypothetical protein [Burkholderia sp. Ac-20365]MBN3761008.1 hypothetical protein [Burkholderia sp. Ac-20365]
MNFLTMVWQFDKHAHIGSDPIFFGTVLNPRLQWDLLNVVMIGTLVASVGLFRGWNWVRWMALVLCVIGYVMIAPFSDARAIPAYVFPMIGNALSFALLFRMPSIVHYFTVATKKDKALTVRGAATALFMLLAAFTVHSIVMGVFRKTLVVEIAWIGTAVFLTPLLLLSALARWNLAVSVREISALLLGAVLYFANLFAASFIDERFRYAASTGRFDWTQGGFLVVALCCAGLALALLASHCKRLGMPDHLAS